MRIKIILGLTGILISFYTAGYNNNSPVKNNSKDTLLPPVETQSPNADYKPAFAGQTRIAGVKTNTAYKVEKLAELIGIPNQESTGLGDVVRRYLICRTLGHKRRSLNTHL